MQNVRTNSLFVRKQPWNTVDAWDNWFYKTIQNCMNLVSLRNVF